ncbi:MAG: LamG-like jellyroll fold domain-containing protein [Bacteroidota bacterium]
MAQRVVSYESGYQFLAPGSVVDGSHCVILEENQRVVSNQDGFQSLQVGSVIDGTTCVVLDPGQQVVSWNDGYLSCAPGSHVDGSNCLVLDLDARIVSYEDGYQTCKVGNRPDGTHCVLLQPGERVVSYESGYQSLAPGSIIDGSHVIILGPGQRVVSYEDGYQSLAPGSVVDGTHCVVLNEGDRVVSWQEGFTTLAPGSVVDGSNCVILGEFQRVVSWNDGYLTCKIGSRVDGVNCLILDEGQHVASWEDGFQTCKVGDKPDGVHCIVLSEGQRVVSWDDGYKTCKPNSYIDHTHCLVLEAGQRVASWDTGYTTCSVGSVIDGTHCLVLNRDDRVVSEMHGYALLTPGDVVDHTSCIVLDMGLAAESGVLQPDEYYVATAQPNASVVVLPSVGNVNFSGNPVNGVPSAFTLGGWVRLTVEGTPQVLFDAPGQFQIAVTADRFVTAEFLAAPEGNSVTSDFQIEYGKWHYIAVAFAGGSAQDGTGALSVFLDGAPKHGTVSTGAGALEGDCTLGIEGQPTSVEFASWEIWSTALAADILAFPTWGTPLPGDPETDGLVVVLDFTHEQVTSTNPGISVTVPEHKVVRACLAMNGGGSAALATPGAYAIGGPGRWSLMTWVKVPELPASAGPFVIYQATQPDTNSPDSPGATLTIQIGSGAQQTLEVVAADSGSGTNVLISQPCSVTDWTNIAVGYDTSVLRLYRNGERIAISDRVTFGAGFTNQRIAVAGTDGATTWAGSLQGLSIWNRQIATDEMVGQMDLMDSQVQGLQALFPFFVDLRDMVSGTLLQATNGGLANEEEEAKTSESAHKPISRREVQSRGAAPGEPTLLQHGEYWALADRLGITSELDKSAVQLEMDEFMELFGVEQAFPTVPDSVRGDLYEGFRRDLQLGYEMRARGVREGSLEVRHGGDTTRFYYHTLNGPLEVYRSNLPLTADEVWTITIVLDVLFMIFAFAGVSITPTTIRRATRGRIIGRVLARCFQVSQSAQATTSGALLVVANIVNALNNVGLLVSILWNVISYSWWTLFFCLGSLILSALALIVQPQSIGWRIANVGIAVGTLIWDISQKPGRNSQLESEDASRSPS